MYCCNAKDATIVLNAASAARRFRNVIAAFLLMAALLMAAPKAFAAEAQEVGLQAGSTNLATHALNDVICTFADVASGTVTWDATSRTITMTDATINLDNQSSLLTLHGILVNGAAVYPTPTVTLKLVGANAIVGSGSRLVTAVRVENANLRIEGPGSLQARVLSSSGVLTATNAMKVDGDIVAASGSLQLQGSDRGLQCGGNLTLEGAAVAVEDTRYAGVDVGGDLSLKAGTLNVNGANGDGVSVGKALMLEGAAVSIENAGAAGINVIEGARLQAGSLSVSRTARNGIDVERDLTLEGAEISVQNAGYAGVDVGGALSLVTGKLNVINPGRNGVNVGGNASLQRATVLVKGAGYSGVDVNGTVALRGGRLRINGAGWSGLNSRGDIVFSGAAVSVSNVKKTSESAVYAHSSAVKVKAGSLKITNCYNGVSCDGVFTLNGSKAQVTMKSLSRYGVNARGVTCKSGSLTVSNCQYGVYSRGNVSIAGASVRVTGVRGMGISAYGGTLKVTKGVVSARCSSTSNYALYSNSGISTNPSCLGKTKGKLGQGARFISGGNMYKVGKNSGKVTLRAYGSTKKKASVSVAKFGGYRYTVNAIAANAFNTKRGRALTKVSIAWQVQSIGAQAFYGTSKLTQLHVNRSNSLAWSLSKNAFTKCGKGAGSALTVKCKYSAQKSALRSRLVKAGLSKNARFV